MSGLRRPLGVALAGGASLGAWQGGFLRELSRRGVEADAWLGMSVGTLNAAACWVGKAGLLEELWKDIGRVRVFELAPRLKPLSLCSDRPIRRLLRSVTTEEAARAAATSTLTVVSLCLERSAPHYARFDPRPGGPWDGPIEEQILASCAIPAVFPPVSHRSAGCALTLIDGGVSGREPLSLADLGGCADVLVLEMTRPDEMGRAAFWPHDRFDQRARENMRRLMSQGVGSLRALPVPPRVLRAHPSRRLWFNMLSFRPADCRAAFELGVADAEDFLRDPGAWEAP